MEQIPPKERYSRNPQSLQIPEPLLRNAMKLAGLPEEGVLTRLAGGFMNANFRAGEGHVLRVHSPDSHFSRLEGELLQRARKEGVHVPKVFGTFESMGRQVLVMEYVDGITLEDALLEGKEHPEIHAQVGAELARVHSIHFERPGFFDTGLQPDGSFTSFSAFMKGYIEKVLGELEARPDKLDPATNMRLRRLLGDRWNIAEEQKGASQLVHCDFNPKNLLVSRDGARLLAILDWEFCMAGNGLIDAGNYFRFEQDFGPPARQAFERGYRDAGGVLGSQWVDGSKLLDLANMASFLERKEDYQASFRTAREVIGDTLNHFGF